MKNEKQALVPRLRFPEFRDVGRWGFRKLENVCEVNPSNSTLPESFVYIDLESVEAGQLIKKKKILREGAPSRAQRILKNGDVIFQIVRPYQKNNLFCEFGNDEKYVASTGYAQLRAFDSEGFLYQVVHTDDFVARVLSKCTGSNYPAINSSDLAKVRLAIPAPDEQEKIADCLSSLDALIAAQADKIDALKTHKKGLMQQLFPREGETVPRLRFPEFRDAGEWAQKSLTKLFDFRDGFAFKSTDFVDSCSENVIQVVRISDINNQNKNEQKVYVRKSLIDSQGLERYLVNNGDLLLSLTGAAGFNFFFWNGGLSVINQRTCKIVPKSETYYPLLRIMEPMLYERLNTRGEGQNNNLSKEFLASTDMLVPTPNEQHKIADCLSSLDALIAADSDKLDALKAHKKGLMQQLFPIVEGVVS